jgi:CHASE3 domain sensor protein
MKALPLCGVIFNVNAVKLRGLFTRVSSVFANNCAWRMFRHPRPGMPLSLDSRRPVSNYLTQGLSVLVCLIGALIMLAWSQRWTGLIQPGPGTATMKFNAACCFVLCGIAAAMLPRCRTRINNWCGGIVLAVGVSTILEYVLHVHVGLDDLFFKEYLPGAGAWPGRMSPLSAGGFAICGVALLLSQAPMAVSHRTLAVGLLATVLGVGASVVLCGYLFAVEAAYGWGAETRMAWHSAVSFLAWSVAVFVWLWRSQSQQRSQLLRWVPAIGSLALVSMAGLISAANVSELHRATEWRKHSYQVVVGAEGLFDAVTDAERELLSYFLTHNAQVRIDFRSSVEETGQSLIALKSLTVGDADEARVLTIGTQIGEAVRYSQNLVSTDDAIGPVETARIRVIMDQAQLSLRALINDENSQLVSHDQSAQSKYDASFRLLIGSTILAALLLLIAHVTAHIEVGRRRGIQRKLNNSMKALQLSEQRQSELASQYRGLYERTPAMVHALDEDTRLQSVSDTWLRQLGYTREEVIGKR